MKKRLILPVIGLFLFGIGTYDAFRVNRNARSVPGKFFWWSSIRLDTDPLNERSPLSVPCDAGTKDCSAWDPIYVDVYPGWLARTLMISGFPAFILGALIVEVFGKLGVSQLTTFLIAVPLLIFAWYYFVASMFGYLLKRRRTRLQEMPRT